MTDEKVMKEYTCPDCGHEVHSHSRPSPINWADGHTCNFKELATCPKCKAKIDTLYIRSSVETAGDFDGEVYNMGDTVGGSKEYSCPVCGDFVTDDEAVAREILKK
jgi:DNA-directed RNA polymerase subunit RPC12/RpoP